MKKTRMLIAAVAAAAVFVPLAVSAQDRAYPTRTSDLSDEAWTQWRVGVETSEAADREYNKGNYTNAAALYEKAITAYKNVQKANEYWNKNGLVYRINAAGRKLQAAQKKQAQSGNNGDSPATPEQKIAAANADAVAEIASLKSALADARKQNAKYKTELDRAAVTAKQVEGILAEKEEADKKYSMLLIRYRDLKDKPADSDADRVLRSALEQEKNRAGELAAAMTKLRGEYDALRKLLADSDRERTEQEKASALLKKRLAEADRNAAEIERLQKKLEEAGALNRENLKKFQAEQERLAGELARKSRQYDEVSENLTKLRAGMNLNEAARKLEQDAAVLRAENDSLRKETAKLNSMIDERDRQLAAARTETERLNTLAKNLTDRTRQLTLEIESAGKNLEKRSAELRKTGLELAAARSECARLKTERDAFAAKISKTPAAPGTDAMAELAQLKVKYEQAVVEAKYQTEKRQSLEAAAKAAKAEIARLEKTLADARAAELKAKDEIKTLLSKDQALKKAADRIAELEKLNKDAAAELAGRKAEIASLRTQMKAETGKLDAKLKDAQKQIDAAAPARAGLAAAEKKIAGLEKSIAARDTEIASLKKIVAEGELREKDVLKKEIGKREAELAKLNARIKELSALADNALALEDELRKIRESMVVVEAEKAAMLNEKTELLSQLASYREKEKNYEKYISNEALLNSALMECKILKAELAEAKKAHSDNKLTKELETARAEAEKVREQYMENEREISVLKAHQLELKIRTTELTEQLEKANREIAVLKKDPAVAADLKKREISEDEKKAAERKVVEAEDRARDMARQIKSLEKQLAERREAEVALMREKRDLEKKLAGETPETRELKDRVAALEKQIDSEKNNASELKKQLADGKTAAEKLAREKLELEKKLAAAPVKPSAAGLPDMKELKEKTAQLEKQLEVQKKLYLLAMREKDDLVRNLQQVGKRANEAEEELKKLRNKNRPNAAAADSKYELQIRLLTEQLQKRDAELNLTGNRLAAQEKELTDLRRDLKNTEDTMAEIAKKSPSGVNPAELAKLREANTRLNETIRQLTAEKADEHDKKEAASRELLVVRAQIEKLRTEIADDSKTKSLKEDLQAKEEALKKSSANLDKTQAELDRAAQEKTQLANEKAKLEQQLDEASRKAFRLQSELRKWTSGPDTVIREKVAEKDKVIDQILKEHAAMADEIARLKSRLSDANTESAAYKKRMIEAKEAEGKLKDALEKAKSGKSATTTMTTSEKIVPAAKEEKPQSGTVIYSTSAKQLAADPAKKEIRPAPVKPVETVRPAPVKPVETVKPAPLAPEKLKLYNDSMAEAKKFEASGDADQALWKYLIASDANPTAWQPHFAIAKIYLTAKKNDLARTEYERALKLGAARDAALEKQLDAAAKR